MSNGLTARSPASTTWSLANGDTASAGLYGRRSLDDSLMCAGPNLAPGRYVTPLSNGTPSTTASALATSSILGSLAKVAGPENRGIFVASMGPTMSPSTMRGSDWGNG